MDKIVVYAPAKINLTLDVTGRRADGYHTIRSVMQTVDLCDRITLQATATPGIFLTLSDDTLPCDEKNTAYKAAALFLEGTKATGGVVIHVDKLIPQQAGMAGGSADAAGVLVGLNHLLNAGWSTAQLCELGLKIGADVPFCIAGGCALCEGIGEVLTPAPAMPDLPLVVVKPPVGVSTAEAYRRVDEGDLEPRPDTEAMLAALQAQDGAAIGMTLGNVFETALQLPEVAAIRAAMAAYHPLGCRMTGSGSAVVALFAEDADAIACAAAMGALGEVYLCRPTGCGPALDV